MARQNINSNLKKKSGIEKDFENVKKIINGEPVDNRTAFSEKFQKIVRAIVQYSEKYWPEACISLYEIYKVSPRKTPLLSEKIKDLLKETVMLYQKSGKKSNIFFNKYLEKIQNAHLH